MKKFLTVLLALSVVFTYTVGSAFAAAPTDEERASAYAESVAPAKVTLLAERDANHSTSAINYAKEKTTAIATYNVVKDLIAVLKAKGIFDFDAFQAEYDAWLEGNALTYINTYTTIGTETYDIRYADSSISAYFDARAAEKEFEGRVADGKAALGEYKPEMYSTKLYTVGGVDYTYRTYAEKLIKEANDALDAIDETSTIKVGTSTVVTDLSNISGTITDYKDAINAILYGFEYTPRDSYWAGLTTLYTSDNKIKDLPKEDKAGVVAGVIGKLNTLLLLDDEAADNDKDQIDLEHAKADFAYYAKVTFFETVKATAEDDVTARTGAYKYDATKEEVAGVKVADPTNITKAEAAAINAAILNDLTDTVEVVNVYLENQSKPEAAKDALKANTGADFEKKVIENALDAKDRYAVAEKTAAKMKDAVDFNGAKKYADADVDAALAKDKVDIYSHFNVAFTAKNYLGQVASLTDDVDVARKAAIAKFKAKMVLTGADKTADADKKYCQDFYVVAAAKDYVVIAAETVAALDDAKTVAEIDAIMADADARLAELRTNDDDTASLAKAIAKYKAALEEYATEQCKLLNNNVITLGNVDTYRVDSFLDVTAKNGVTSALEDGFDILDDVKNEAAVPAAYEEAKALFKDIKTDADLKAEAANVTKLLGELTAVPARDLSNEEKYLEAYAAYKAYLGQYGAVKSDVAGSLVFDQKMANLKTYQVAAIQTAISKLPAVIDLGDKEAVAAIRTQLEKYLTLYKVNSATYDGANDAYGAANFVINTTAYGDLVDAEEAVWNAEVSAVAKQIMKLTDDSTLEEMQAAAAAYDALSGGQQQDVRDILGQAYMYKLEMVVKAKIKAVESLKITASSKATKGAMTIKWTVKGDAAAADGFRVYRSKKMNSGYGSKPYYDTKSASKMSYKNTKDLKKGTRYYYKVRAYVVVDGKTYFSDYSNKAYRVAK